MAVLDRGLANSVVGPESMVRDEPGDGVVVPGRQEIGFCDLVVALREERIRG
jgi:hypothetical protein